MRKDCKFNSPTLLDFKSQHIRDNLEKMKSQISQNSSPELVNTQKTQQNSSYIIQNEVKKTMKFELKLSSGTSIVNK